LPSRLRAGGLAATARYSAEFIRTVLLQTLVTAQWFYMLNCRAMTASREKGLLAIKGFGS
jgi:hypothetical protein